MATRKRPAAAPSQEPSEAQEVQKQPHQEVVQVQVGTGVPLMGNQTDPLAQELAALPSQLQDEAVEEADPSSRPDPPPGRRLRRQEDPSRVGESAASRARLLRQRLADNRRH